MSYLISDEEDIQRRMSLSDEGDESEYSEDDEEKYITDVSKRKERRKYIKTSG